MTPPQSNPSENPYRPAPGAPAPILAGRDAEINAIITSIELTRSGAPASPLILTGRKGVGKTATLHVGAAEAIKRRGLVLSAEASRDESLLASFASSLERAERDTHGLTRPLRDALAAARKICLTYEPPGDVGALELSVKSDQGTTTLRKAIHDLNETVRRHNRYLVLAVDEMDECNIAEL